jgi:proteasome lid subunit RPN8/RPN11
MITLTDEIKEKFIEHASRDFPREACGLVAVVKGKQQYYPCMNLMPGNDDFYLDPADFIKVEDFVSSHAGDLVAVLHSHPATPPVPSMADKANCEASGLPWFIYSIKTQEWNSFAPSGYKAPLIGRPYRYGIFDCYSALRDWYGEKLNINIPDFHREPKFWEKGQNIIIENFQKAGFEEVKDGSIQVGDVILANINSPIVNHCAVYIGNDQIFHQMMNRLSGREVYGGWIKKNTRMIVRYKR